MRRIQARRQASGSTDRPGLIDFVADSLPGWERFDYFAPYAKALEGAIGSELTVCFAAPPGHGKTSFTIRGLLWICRYFPGFHHAYVTYNQRQSERISKDFAVIAESLGFAVTGTLDKRTVSFGDGAASTLLFTSVKGSLTGNPIDGLCVIDDFIKGQAEARSKAHREAGIRWWTAEAETRRHVGTSYVVMATRWPGGDLTDHLLKNAGFRYINLKAIAEPEGPEDLDESGVVLSDPLGRHQGESLSPKKPPEFFARHRKNVHWWVAMFQGMPRAEGSSVFAMPGTLAEDGTPVGALWYSELPKVGYRVAYGVDLAYSSKTSADWSILVEGWAVGNTLYIASVQRKQVPAPNFLLTMVAAKTNRPGAPFRFYSGGGGEKGSGDFIRQKLGRIFKAYPASADKLVRATTASLAWNEGRILLPDPAKIKAEWLDDFLAVVTTFTGTPGEQDDDVDALAACHDQLMHRNKMFQALAGRQ